MGVECYGLPVVAVAPVELARDLRRLGGEVLEAGADHLEPAPGIAGHDARKALEEGRHGQRARARRDHGLRDGHLGNPALQHEAGAEKRASSS